MDLDTSPQIDAQNTSYTPYSPNPLPELESVSNVEGDLLPKKDIRHTLEHSKKQTGNMDLDDISEEDGGVSLTAEPNSISVSILFSKKRSTESTDSSVPNDDKNTPMVYARSPCMKIPEKESGGLDLDDDDDSLPELEEIGGGASISPPSPAILSNTHVSSALHIEDTDHLNPHTNTLSQPIPNNETSKAIDASPYSPTATTPSTAMSKADPPAIKISWFVWPPEDLYEKDLCERVCEEVAFLHGFREVVIKSHIITHHTEQTWSTTRHIYVDPYLIATFTSVEFSPHKRFWEKITQTADVHVGPQEEADWRKWGLWRKGEREAVVWM